MEKEPKRWVTVAGKHFPIFEDENGNEVFGVGKEETAVRSAEDLIPKNSYTNDPEYQKASKGLGALVDESLDLNHKFVEAAGELDKARDKHLDPEMVQLMSRREARLFVYDEDFPDTAEAKKKLDKIKTRQDKVEKEISQRQDVMRKLEHENSKVQREQYGKPEFKEAKGEYEGFKTNESTVSNVDSKLEQGKAKVVEMTPEQYIKECAYYIFNNSTLERTLNTRAGNKDTEKYAKMMREGTKFDTPYIDYGNAGQEGLHRAVAAYINGYEKIPVIVIGKR